MDKIRSKNGDDRSSTTMATAVWQYDYDGSDMADQQREPQNHRIASAGISLRAMIVRYTSFPLY